MEQWAYEHYIIWSILCLGTLFSLSTALTWQLHKLFYRKWRP